MIQDPNESGLVGHPKNSPLYAKKGTIASDDVLVVIGKQNEQDPDIRRSQKQLALKLIVMDKIEDALDRINDSLKNFPDDSINYSLKGECYVKMGKYEEAIEFLDKAIELDDTNQFGHLYKGVALKQLQKYDEALIYLDKCIKLDPNNVEAYNTKGNTEFDLQQYAEAIKCWEDALKVDPEYDQAYNNIGILLSQQGKIQDSLIYFNKALAIEPNHPLYYCNRAIAYVNLDTEKALEDFKKARDLIADPQNTLQLSKKKQDFIKQRISAIADLEEKKRKFKDLLSKLNMNKETYEQINQTLQQVDSQAKDNKVYQKCLYNEQSDVIAQMQQQIYDLQNVLNKTGLQKKYEMKLELDEMEQHGGINGNLQKEYYCTFYWTLLEYLTAYQQLSLNVFKAGDNAYAFDKDKQNQSKQVLVKMGAQYIGTQVKKLAEKVPVIGSIIEYLDDAVDTILTTRKENLFLIKIRAINDIIKHKKNETLSFEDLSLSLQLAAFELCKKQKDDIINRVKSKEEHIGQKPKSTKAWDVFVKALDDFKNTILATNKTDMFEGEPSAMALEDVLSLLVYFFDQYELIINSEDKLSDIIVNLVLPQKARLYTLEQIEKVQVQESQITKKVQDQPMEKQEEGCCNLI